MGGRNDLTSGPIVRRLLLFFIPIAAGTLFQQLYNAVDALVVSKFVGTEALAAVGGSPAQVIGLVIGFCVALSGGASVVISQLYGAREEKNLNAAIQTAYLFCCILGVAVGAVIVLFTPQILTVLKTPEDTFADAVKYMRIYFAGSIFVLTFNMGSGILRAVGDSRFPFICLCISCGLNIILDLLFVLAFRLGVPGVAWATILSQAVSTVLVLSKLLHADGPCRLNLKTMQFSRLQLRRMMAIGVPSGLQSCMYGVSNMILQVGVNLLSTVAVAAWSLSGKVDGAYWAVSGAFGTAVTTFIAQNYGAGKTGRIQEAAKKSLLMLVLFSVVMSGILLLAARPLLHLFTEDPDLIETTWIIVLFCVPAYAVWSVIEVYSGILRGLGDTLKPAVIIGIGVCFFRILWAVTVFRAHQTLQVICLCYPISWVITAAAIAVYYRKTSKNMKCLSGIREE